MNKSMKLGAIIIESHEFLTSKPEILTFGSFYNYILEVQENSLILKISNNSTYIPSFFKLKNDQLDNLSAIVGKNGIGKTTLLNLIRSIINETYHDYPHNNSLIIIEKNNEPYIYYNNLEKELTITFNNKPIKLSTINGKIKTIYYSPVFNYSYSQNYNPDESFDISFDNILYHDLTSSKKMESSKNGWEFSPNEELIFKNSLRQLDFLNSKEVRNSSTIKSLFDINYPNQFKIYIRGYHNSDEDEDWNTPMQFRPILKDIKEKLKEEIKNWHKISNQLDINKYLLKLYSIRAFLTILFEKMEQKNSFLQEGYIEYDKNKFKTSNALDLFFYFIENAQINYNKEYKNIFKANHIYQLFDKLYETIDKVEQERLIQKDFVYSSYEDTILLLELQKAYISDLSNYFYLFYKTNNKEIELSDRVEGFLHFYPFDRKLSSGQHSFLNLFSRIYWCIKNIDFSQQKKNTHFVLLLDEGDLTFHPDWKRKYVKMLVDVIPVLFKETFNNISIEIILTTHDPLTLSDIPRTNVNYLISKNNKTIILNSENENIPNKTFGANISEILAHSYFLEDGLIGDFSYDKIRQVINWLNDTKNNKNSNYYKALIKLIDEPIVQLKLSEMYDEKMKTNIQLDILNEQIKKLEELKKQLS